MRNGEKSMKVRLFGISACIAAVMCTTNLSAQKLSVLPQDPAVSSAVFPNGLSCYVVENQGSKGVADFVLIKRDYNGNEHICSRRNFLMASETAVDSTMLNFMKKVEADQIPADCALIISGDVKSSDLMTKLKYMSLMVNSSKASLSAEYTWTGDDKVCCSVVPVADKDLSTVRFEWEAPRLPMERMNTTMSALYEKAVWELGDVVVRSIRRSLQKQGVPYADVAYHHADCTNGMQNDSYVIEVTVADADIRKTQYIVSSVLASLDRGEASTNDVILAEKAFFESLKKSADRALKTNEEYVRMCSNAFLYNSPLSSDKERLAFLSSKDISDSERVKIFSSITSALVNIDTLASFNPYPSSGVMLSDTLSLPGMALKTNVRATRKDSFSGGTVWTYANGFKVIYIKRPNMGRELYYSLSLRGGFGSVEDLERGEGAYMSEYMDQCWISGMKASDFKEMLGLAGMSMDVQVGLFNTVLSGKVEDNNAGLLMKSLLAVANECRPDTTQIDFFVKCEHLRRKMLSGREVNAEIDALMCPGYQYTLFKTGTPAGKETFAKADALFSSMTSKMNDGLLVIVGGMDDADLKKTLQMYVGGFNIKNIASRRPSMEYHPVSGWSSYNVEGESDAVYLTMSTPLSMTAVNHFAAEVAVMMLERRVNEIFEPLGIPVKVAYARNIYPEERFSVMVQLDGQCGLKELARLIAIPAECKETMTDAELRSCKEYVKNSYAQKLNTVEYWLKVVPLRHLEGKDFTTGYSARIDAVTQQIVQKIFEALEHGAGIEYITTKK